MSQPCTLPTLGHLPARLDPFGQIRPALNGRMRLRFGEGEGGGGAGGDGGAGDGTGGEGDGSADGGDGTEGLGDAGKQALERMKADLKAAKAEAKAYKDLGLTPDQIKALQTGKPAGEGGDPADIEQRVQTAIAEATEQITQKAAAKSRASEVRAQAAELGFIKPQQALALLDQAELAKVTVNDDGDADAAAVKTLLEGLAKDSPFLLKPTDKTPDHRSAGIGGTGSGTKPDIAPGRARLEHAYANTQK